MGEGSYEHKDLFVKQMMCIPHSHSEVVKEAVKQKVIDGRDHWKRSYSKLVKFAESNKIAIYKRPKPVVKPKEKKVNSEKPFPDNANQWMEEEPKLKFIDHLHNEIQSVEHQLQLLKDLRDKY